MGVKLIDHNEINETSSISAYTTGESEQSQIDDISRRTDSSQTEIRIITHIEDFETLEKEWQELVMEANTQIFQTFEWNQVWWKHFGANKKLHILTVYTENKLIGIAPLFEDTVTLFGHKVYTCLRFLGSYVSQPEGEPLLGSISYSDYLDCIIRPGCEQIFYQSFLQHFNDINSVYDEIILDEVPKKSDILNTLLPLIASGDQELNCIMEKASSSPVIMLDSTWDEYLKSLPKKARYHARRYFKRSETGNPNAFKIDKIKDPIELPVVLTDFIRMHQQQWNDRGFSGTFSEKRMRDFFMEIAQSFYEKNWIEVNVAIPEEENAKYVAIDVCITYKNRISLMHRGMDEESQYIKQGPGNVLLYARLHEAINDGVKVFDMLRGAEEFKLRLATEIKQNQKITLCPDYKNGRLLPRLIKSSMNVVKYIRNERLHLKYLFEDKSFNSGLSDYIHLLHERIEQRSHK
ncbi:MAG: hypothetical protein CL666_04070 [Balneola sp.]|nr:hypothetical protein [Balneola sp.]|tara:strand:+ start:16110 stop:17498 length:1389 start_codon:yes stop_codon:yes gene_type:complete